MKSNTYHPPPVLVLPESRDLLVLHFLFLLKTERSLITASHTNAPFRLANTIIRDLNHMSAVILLPFFPHLFSVYPQPFPPCLPPFTLLLSLLHDSPSAEISHSMLLVFSSHQYVAEDPTSPNSLALS